MGLKASQRHVGLPVAAGNGQQHHSPLQCRQAKTAFCLQPQIQDRAACEKLAKVLRQPVPERRSDESRERHSLDLHPHQVEKVHSGQTEPGQTGGDAFQKKGMFQRTRQPARINRPARRQGHAIAQGLPIGADLLDQREGLGHALVFRSGECQVHITPRPDAAALMVNPAARLVTKMLIHPQGRQFARNLVKW